MLWTSLHSSCYVGCLCRPIPLDLTYAYDLCKIRAFHLAQQVLTEPGVDCFTIFGKSLYRSPPRVRPRRTASGCVFGSRLGRCMSCISNQRASRPTFDRRAIRPSATYAVNPSRSRKPSRTLEPSPFTNAVTSTPTAGRSGSKSTNSSETVKGTDDGERLFPVPDCLVTAIDTQPV